MAREGHVCSPRRRPLPASTVHDPGWHPGRFTCYSLSDHDAALAARNLGHLSSCLQRLWMNCDARFEVWLESCNHDRPAISLRGGALSSHPTPCTRYDKCAQELEQLCKARHQLPLGRRQSDDGQARSDRSTGTHDGTCTETESLLTADAAHASHCLPDSTLECLDAR